MSEDWQPQDEVVVQFWKKKMDMADESEACDECMAKRICTLREKLHKIKVGEKTIIEKCSLMVQ